MNNFENINGSQGGNHIKSNDSAANSQNQANNSVGSSNGDRKA